MKQITVEDLQNSIYFNVDYRSPPVGIGHINYPNKDSVLITDPDNCITCIDDAKKDLKKDHVPTDVIHIENWEEFQFNLKSILRKLNVQYVYDTELFYEFKGKSSVGEHIFKLEDWIKLRKV